MFCSRLLSPLSTAAKAKRTGKPGIPFVALHAWVVAGMASKAQRAEMGWQIGQALVFQNWVAGYRLAGAPSSALPPVVPSPLSGSDEDAERDDSLWESEEKRFGRRRIPNPLYGKKRITNYSKMGDALKMLNQARALENQVWSFTQACTAAALATPRTPRVPPASFPALLAALEDTRLTVPAQVAAHYLDTRVPSARRLPCHAGAAQAVCGARPSPRGGGGNCGGARVPRVGASAGARVHRSQGAPHCAGARQLLGGGRPHTATPGGVQAPHLVDAERGGRLYIVAMAPMN